MRITSRRAPELGFTLIEVMIALALLLVVSTAYMTTSIFNARSGARAKTDVYATELINRTIEDLRTSNYDNLGSAVGTEARFLATQTFRLDPSHPTQTITFQVQVQFLGFGRVASATASTLTAVFPAGFPAWTENQWVGHMVMMRTGSSADQIMYITANSANTLTICRNLDGSGGGGWYSGHTPVANDYFEIDGGKTVAIIVSWTERGVARQLQRLALIPTP